MQILKRPLKIRLCCGRKWLFGEFKMNDPLSASSGCAGWLDRWGGFRRRLLIYSATEHSEHLLDFVGFLEVGWRCEKSLMTKPCRQDIMSISISISISIPT